MAAAGKVERCPTSIIHQRHTVLRLSVSNRQPKMGELMPFLTQRSPLFAEYQCREQSSGMRFPAKPQGMISTV
jgi:hypothetical protein